MFPLTNEGTKILFLTLEGSKHEQFLFFYFFEFKNEKYYKI
jgi:hypothetical protein